MSISPWKQREGCSKKFEGDSDARRECCSRQQITESQSDLRLEQITSDLSLFCVIIWHVMNQKSDDKPTGMML